MAWKLGYASRFCVESEATHVRATVSRHYGEQEISRIFERNRTLFTCGT
jgi:hypothetical protein